MSHLTQEQRYKIDVLRQEKYSQTAIAKLINKDNLFVGSYKGIQISRAELINQN